MSDWSRFKDTETEILIEYFQNEDMDDSIRNDSFLALCLRFRADLIKKSEVICSRRGHDPEVAYQIVENTLIRYGKSRNFKTELGNQLSIDDCFRVYLYRIANNELCRYYKNEEKRKRGQLYDGSETIITVLPVDIKKLDPVDQIIHEHLMALSYSHRVIYLTYKTYEREGVNLPRKLQKELREHLGGISQATIRAYKKEAIDLIDMTKQTVKTVLKIKQ